MDRVHPQALSPENTDLSSIEHNLVLMSVDIHQLDTKLRLHRMVVQNLQTQEFWVSVFFYNAFIGSEDLPFTLNGNIVEHLVFLDIPPGTYQITKTEFAYSQYDSFSGGNLQVLKHELLQKVKFEVLEGKPTYIGNLKVEIVGASIVGTKEAEQSILLEDSSYWDGIPGLRGSIVEATRTTISTIGGVLYFSSPGARELDLQKAKGRYPALQDISFSNRNIWIER
ncbi:MAG: hypothetical protein OEQ39_28610 [Gammaproteobacteria bacterium]|nr:hypothetical protein [Gammaproteobacteria bacterium]